MLKCLRDEYGDVSARFDTQPTVDLLHRGWELLAAIQRGTLMANLIALPDDPRPAIEIFLAYAKGDVIDLMELAHAGLHMAAYGLGLVHTHPPVVFATILLPTNIDGCVRAIARAVDGRECKATPGDVGAIDWSVVLPLVLQLISLFFKKK